MVPTTYVAREGGVLVAESVPAEVIEAAVVVCGTAFYYRDRLRVLFVSAGAPATLYDWHAIEGSSKFVVARHAFADLAGLGESGQLVIRRVVTELANMAKPDPTATDQQAATKAITDLREASARRRVLLDVDSAERTGRQNAETKRLSASEARRRSLSELQTRLGGLTQSAADAQMRGYQLERLLADLFTVFELVYRPSYRLEREQIDGAFEYKGFSYLVEARWRAAAPDFGDLADFKGKVDGKLESTRGMFISMAGFDDKVVGHFMGAARGTRNNLILVSGQDLSLIVEGHRSLLDALDYKIGKASQEGVWWAPLAGA